MEEIKLQVGVKILLENREGKYLVLFRTEGRYWDMPGGRINPGTPLIDNLKREVAEETGLKIKGLPELITVQDLLWPDKHVVRITYSGFADGEVKLSEEHSEYKWLTMEEISELKPLDKYFKEVLEKLFVE